MQHIVVDVYESEAAEWCWRAEAVQLQRGRFRSAEQADDDAAEHAELLIAALAARSDATVMGGSPRLPSATRRSGTGSQREKSRK